MIGWKITLLTGLAAGAIAWLTSATSAAKEARPPKWSRDVLDTFFDDAREKLEGPRPAYGVTAKPEDAAKMDAAAANPGGAFLWSKIISAETLESEVKRLTQSVANIVTTPSAFKGGGHKDARCEFSELAVVFAVLAEYDADARWKDSAAGLRVLFSQSAANAKVGTDTTYREAAARKQDLADLVRGGRPQVAKADAAVADWSQVSAREPLMQRLNISHQERLTKWLADANAFRRNQSDVVHESQIVAMLADVIHRKEFEYWDDDTFVGYANDLQQAASDIAAAATADNFEQARAAIGRATKACSNCHAGYRG